MFTEVNLSDADKEKLLGLLKNVSELLSKEDSPIEYAKRTWETEKEDFVKICVKHGVKESYVRTFIEVAVAYWALNLN